MEPPSQVVAGVRTVTAHRQVRFTSTRLGLLLLWNRKTASELLAVFLFELILDDNSDMNEVRPVTVSLANKSHTYQIRFAPLLRNAVGDWAAECLSRQAKKIVIISNARVFGIYGHNVADSLRRAGFEVSIHLMKDGERYKNLRSLTDALRHIGEQKLSRSDAVVALGGGVVGDLAGFAAATYLRGISFLQIPTTVLSMIDSSVGGKTGVNTNFGKNLIGAFHQPDGVLIDVTALRTLPKREVSAGFCEAIKHGLIANMDLYQRTSGFLSQYPLRRFKKCFDDDAFLRELEIVMSAQVAFKAEIVMNDEREDLTRSDGKSRKILNFGHTLGHALEKVTNYRRFKHGEAVGYGILFAVELSKKLDILDQNELKSLNDVFRCLERLPQTKDIAVDSIIQAFAFDKKNIGDSLQWILLEGVGKPVVVPSSKVDLRAVTTSLRSILGS